MCEIDALKRKSFEWTDYLKLHGGEPAPLSCFRQAETPPRNEFKLRQKILTVDPNNRTSMCIATIIETKGSRIRLRLDGTGNRTDFLQPVDSQFIRPFEHSLKDIIKQPIGFISSLKWPKFLDKILKSRNQEIFAASSCFKTPPRKPPKNDFEVGQKLEAVDPKDSYRICPASVADLDGDRILVSFDGWSQSCNFWSSYSSRDIFPVGWCKLSGHYLEWPGYFGFRLKKRKSTASSVKIEDSILTSVCNTVQSNRNNKKQRCVVKAEKTVNSIHLTNLNDHSATTNEPVVATSIVEPSESLQINRRGDNIIVQHQAQEISALHTESPITRLPITNSNFTSDIRLSPQLPAINTVTNGSEGISTTYGINYAYPNEIVTSFQNYLQYPFTTSCNPLQQTHAGIKMESPHAWDSYQLANYIIQVDPALAQSVDTLLNHGIDGKALANLTADFMVKTMNIRAGPALRLSQIIERLKRECICIDL